MMPEIPAGDTSCRLVRLDAALAHFFRYSGPTQSQFHIKPLHWYVACRLVLEGGFRPEEISPHPPFRSTQRTGSWHLEYDLSVASNSERTILGGLKTKNVDVVVVKDGIGPVLAVSVKGTIGAFRNLTNRMEEAVGDCTNLHITYPALVAGFFTVLRANRLVANAAGELPDDAAPAVKALRQNDIAVDQGGEPVESIVRYHTALRELGGRKGIRDEVSSYEAVSMALVEVAEPGVGTIFAGFPPTDSPLHHSAFFPTLYRSYDERYVYSAPDLKRVTSRKEWRIPESTVRMIEGLTDYDLRLSEG